MRLRKHAGGLPTRLRHKLSIRRRTSDTERALHDDFIVSTLALIIIGGRGIYLSIAGQKYEIGRQGSLIHTSDKHLCRFIWKFIIKFIIGATINIDRRQRGL